jgi:hypothetical protein
MRLVSFIIFIFLFCDNNAHAASSDKIECNVEDLRRLTLATIRLSDDKHFTKIDSDKTTIYRANVLFSSFGNPSYTLSLGSENYLVLYLMVSTPKSIFSTDTFYSFLERNKVKSLERSDYVSFREISYPDKSCKTFLPDLTFSEFLENHSSYVLMLLKQTD